MSPDLIQILVTAGIALAAYVFGWKMPPKQPAPQPGPGPVPAPSPSTHPILDQILAALMALLKAQGVPTPAAPAGARASGEGGAKKEYAIPGGFKVVTAAQVQHE